MYRISYFSKSGCPSSFRYQGGIAFLVRMYLCGRFRRFSFNFAISLVNSSHSLSTCSSSLPSGWWCRVSSRNSFFALWLAIFALLARITSISRITHPRAYCRSIFSRGALTLYDLLPLLCMLNVQLHVPRENGGIGCLASLCPRAFLRPADLLGIHRDRRVPPWVSFLFAAKPKAIRGAFFANWGNGEIDGRRGTLAPQDIRRGDSTHTANWQGGTVEKVRESRARTRRTRSQWVTLTARRESRPCNSQIEGPIAWSNLRTH